MEKTFSDEFVEIFEKNITRQGAKQLLNWLMHSDFFIAPASTKFHLSEPEGLLRHSLNVYKRLKDECEHTNFQDMGMEKPSDETIAIVGLLHDLCKVNIYKVSERNQKQEDGSWKKVPYYTVEDELPYGHGEKSVMMISGFMKLTRDEMYAIRWHMGGFDDSARAGSFSISVAFEKFPFAVQLHLADLESTYLREKHTSVMREH